MPILVVRASGGLSNRLQAVLAGVAYCLLTQRALCVDWRDAMYSDDLTNIFPTWFHVQGIPTATHDDVASAVQKSASIYPPFWQQRWAEAVAVEYLFNNDHLLPHNVAKTSIDFKDLYRDEPVLVGWGWDMQPALTLVPFLAKKFPQYAHIMPMTTLQKIFTSHIHLAPDIKEEIQHFRNTHFQHEHMIGLHIRSTDLQSPLEKMLQILKKVVTPHTGIFLTTDNAYVEKMVRQLYPQSITTSKYFPKDNMPLHSFSPCIASSKKGREALLDMFLLAQCQEIIFYRHSSFAQIPLLLAGLEASRVHVV